MSGQAESPARRYRPRSLTEMFASPPGQEPVAARETGVAQTVSTPPLRSGAAMLQHMPTRAMVPDVASYVAGTPWVCALQDAVSHGPHGVVTQGDVLIADTLGGDARAPYWQVRPDGVDLPPARTRHLPGPVLRLQGFAYWNYWHWTIDGIGRLAVDPDLLRQCRHVLLPPVPAPHQRAMLQHLGVGEDRRVEIGDGEAVSSHLILSPWTLSDEFRIHPRLVGFLRGLASPMPDTPLRLYIDRSGGAVRPLLNEDVLAEAARRLGCVPVRLETLALREQMALFAGASCIIAPHGAGLTGLVFGSPECRVLELQMDSYVHWCFRRVAAIQGMPYDCIIGRRQGGPDDNVHAQSWIASPLHMAAAAERLFA